MHKTRSVSLFFGVIGTFAFFLLFFSAPSARAAEILVPGDQATIQAAIDAASNTDTITVSAGTHVVPSSSGYVFGGLHTLTIKAATDATPGGTNTILDASGVADSTSIFNIVTANITIRGFEILAPPSYPAIEFSTGSTGTHTIRNNIINGEDSSACITVWSGDNTVNFTSNIFYDCNDQAITLSGDGGTSFTSTLTGNTFEGGMDFSGAAFAAYTLNLTDNIVYAEEYPVKIYSAGTTTVTSDYNNYYSTDGEDPFYDNDAEEATSQSGSNDISVAPGFSDSSAGDFSLAEYSACIDTATGGADMGAISQPTARRSTIYVAGSGQDFTSIAEATAAALPNATTIEVYAGTYSPEETISLPAGVTLQPYDNQSVILSGASVTDDHLITLSGVNGVNISDLTISGSAAGLYSVSASPLSYGGQAYSFGDGVLWYGDSEDTDVGVADADGTAITTLDGSSDINVALCLVNGAAYGTIYHAAGIATTSSGITDWWNENVGPGLGGMTVDCTGRYYKTGIFTANGNYQDYTYAGELDGDGEFTAAILAPTFDSTTPYANYLAKSAIYLSNAGTSGSPTEVSGVTLSGNLVGITVAGTSVLSAGADAANDTSITGSTLYNVVHSSSGTSQMINVDFEYDSDPSLTSVTGAGTLEAYYRTRASGESSTVGTVTWTDSSGAAAKDTADADIGVEEELSSGSTGWITPKAYEITSAGAGSLNDFSLTYTDALGDSSVTTNTLDTVDEEVTLVIGGVYGLLPPPSGISDYFSPPAPPDGGDDGDEGGDRDEGDGDEGDGDSGDGEAGGLPTGFAEADKFLLPVELEKGKARLLKVPGHSAVYIVNPASGQRQVFLHGRNFEAFGLAWDDVEEVEPEELAEFTLSKPALYPVGSLVKFPTDPKVYLVTGSYTLRWIEADEFEEAGYSFGDIRDVPVAFFALFDFE